MTFLKPFRPAPTPVDQVLQAVKTEAELQKEQTAENYFLFCQAAAKGETPADSYRVPADMAALGKTDADLKADVALIVRFNNVVALYGDSANFAREQAKLDAEAKAAADKIQAARDSLKVAISESYAAAQRASEHGGIRVNVRQLFRRNMDLLKFHAAAEEFLDEHVQNAASQEARKAVAAANAAKETSRRLHDSR